MRKVLIISPYFPPSNAADMQRIRMSLPFFAEFGWEAEVVCVNDIHADMVKDELLLLSIPKNIKVHQVNALQKKYTAKLGLGSIAIRSMWYYKEKVNELLKRQTYDLIYFSTTQFPICILGAYWKRKFGTPYVIDMQDPWHSEYYLNKPKAERPKKYWFSYRLNKYLEPIALQHVDGLISVSAAYIDTLKNRYPKIKNIPAEIITFGAFERDFEIAKEQASIIKQYYQKNTDQINLTYIGRGGQDMQRAIKLLFTAFKQGITENIASFKIMKFNFVGTSYAGAGLGKKTIEPIAVDLGLGAYVNEQTDRIPFYESIVALQESDVLIIPGSDDPSYTASKIYPYILAKKPLLAIFSSTSSASGIITSLNAGTVADLNDEEGAISIIYNFLKAFEPNHIIEVATNWEEFEHYSAKQMTKRQCDLFNEAIVPANETK